MTNYSTKNICIALDDAFWLEPREPNYAVAEKLQNSELPIIGLSFYYRWGQALKKDEYIAKLARLVDTLIEVTQCIILALPHTYSASSFSDVKFAQNIRDKSCFRDNFWIIEDFLIDREIKYLTGQCDYVFSNRFHGIIFALSQGVPCTAIYQEQYTQVKLESAYEMINLVPRLISINEKDENISKGMIEHWHTRQQMHENLACQLEGARNYQKVQDEALRTVVASSQSQHIILQ